MSRFEQSYQSVSSSRYTMPNSELISKIMALESTLYEANLENQELRQRKIQLQSTLQQKKVQLYGQPAQVKQSRSKRLSRNNSQPYVHCHHSSDTDSFINAFSSGLMSIQPQRGRLITGDQPNFQALKLGQTDGSQQQSKMSAVSSPRTIGIRKNVKKVMKIQNEQSVDIGFKSIEQIWNGKKGDTFLKKTSQRPGQKKKKSYLN